MRLKHLSILCLILTIWNIQFLNHYLYISNQYLTTILIIIFALLSLTTRSSVAGRKLTTAGRRVPSSGGGPLMKSQTLPRSMGRSSSQPNNTNGGYNRYPMKPASTPPAVKRQLSVSIFYWKWFDVVEM